LLTKVFLEIFKHKTKFNIMETNYTLKRLKLIWPVFALFMFASLFVNAQEKNTKTLHLNIECVGQVAVAGSSITDRTIQGPVVMSDLGDGSPIALNAIIYFEPMTDVANPCYGFTGWEVTNQDGDAMEWDDVLEQGSWTLQGGATYSYRLVLDDNYILTAYFGLETDADPLNPFEVNFVNATPISTITGTPVIVPVEMVYGDVSETGCEVGWVVDAMVRITDEDGNLVLPPGAEFLEVTYGGAPVPLVAPVLTSAEFMMSDIIGGPAPLAGHLNSSFNWTYTIVASPTIGALPTVYNVEIISVTMEEDGDCPTILARNDFDISYDKVDMEVTSPFGCVAEELCFSLTVEYPDIENIGAKFAFDVDELILNNLYLAGPFTAGMEVTVSGYWGGHWVDGTWTIPGNVSLTGFYLSQILANSVSAETEYGWDLKTADAGTFELEVCVNPLGLGETKFELSAVAQLEIYDFDEEEYILQDFEYGNTTATLTSDPKFDVQYQKSTGEDVTWTTTKSDMVCGLEYELRARVVSTPTTSVPPAGEWRVDLTRIPSGANVTFEDKTDPTTDVVVSSFGLYHFYWHIPGLTANQIACGSSDFISVGFYPTVTSTLSVTEANAKVCSLATTVTRTKAIVANPPSNNFTASTTLEGAGNYFLKEVWDVKKWTYDHDAVAPVEKWAYRSVGAASNFLTQSGATNNWTFNAAHLGDAGYGKYRIIYNTTMYGKTPGPGRDLCSSTKDTIYVEFYWKPLAEIILADYDKCEYGLFHATTNNIDPVTLRGNLPKTYTYEAGTGVVVDPYVNGKGQWTQTAGPAVTYVTGYGDLTKREIRFHVPTYGEYTFEWVVTNDAPAGIPCANPAVDEVTITFPEPAMANVNTSDLIFCFTQVKWESYMDVITGTNAYSNPVFIGSVPAANPDNKIRVNKNWVTNYNGNALQLNATKSANSTGTWSVTDGTAANVAFVLPTTAGVAPDPRVASTWTTTGAINAGNAIAVFLHPGKYELTWTVTSGCPPPASDSFEVEFLASPEPLKLLEVTEGGQVVPPRPVCVGDEVHYILRRTTDNSDPVPGEEDVIWTIPANFEVLATGGGGGIKQYWIKGVWTDEVAGAHFEVEEFGHPIHGCATINKFDPVLYKPSMAENLVITGPTVVADGSVVEYSIPAKPAGTPAITYLWNITGGTIVSGQGTIEVEVLWSAAATTRTLSVQMSGADYCNSPQVAGPITVTVERGSLAGQIKYFNNVETAMPTPFNTEYGGLTPDYFYVELWEADEDGPVAFIDRVAADYNLELDLEAYFEFDDLDPTAHYVLRVLDGGFYYLQTPVADAQLRYTYTWNKWGGVNATDAVAIAQMHLEMEVNDSWPWVGTVDEDYGFFSTQVADVNSNGIVGLEDAIYAMRRFVNPTQSFPNNTPNFRVSGRFVDALPEITFPEWIGHRENDLQFDFVRFGTPATSYQFTSPARNLGYISAPFMLEEFDHFINVYYVATGDVSSSYIPTPIGQKDDVMTKLSLVPSGMTIDAQVGDIVHIPVTLDRAAQIGAMAIGLNFNSSYVEVVENKFEALNGHDLMFIDNNAGVVRFASLFPEAGSNVAIIPVRIKTDFEGQLFTLDAGSSMADMDRNELDATMNVDAVSTKSVTGIEDPAVANLRISNFPNPFTTTTTIEYTLPEAGQVTLAVYNNVGQLVTTLVSEAKEAGLHQVALNRSDINGDGMYIYRIYVEAQSRSYTATGNVVLMK
jgi:hypothetical protein